MTKLFLTTAMTLGLMLGAASSYAQTGKADGEIRKVDADTGKVTMKHGPIVGDLEMPGMTMVFQVKDKSLLDKLKAGDRVDATIAKENGAFFIQAAEVKK